MLKKTIILLIILILPIIPSRLKRYEFPVFRVIIDPGHGGVCKKPMSKYGDRYDKISKTYLDHFKDGASSRGIYEHQIVYSIAEKVKKILKYCSPEGRFPKFHRILRNYTNDNYTRISIISGMSRSKSITENESNKLNDPNTGYRLFDYPDKDGNIKPGRLTRINSLKPNLVVSLHLAGSAGSEYKGMNPVLAGSYKFLNKGLLYLKGIEKNKKFFYKSPLSNWFCESNKRSSFKWFLSDTSMYFTGYPLHKNHTVNVGNFKGYRHNMVTWTYKDRHGWEDLAKTHVPKTKYSSNYKDIVLEGKFWDREKSKYEEYRRSGGYEGFGGDNAYASYEIIRYILYSLNSKGYNHRKQRPGKSYISIYILPLHINAINAFIELGYLNRRRDRYLLTKRQNEIAEGIAVGIYSLFAGIKTKKNFKYKPKGKKIDLEKYHITSDKSYFDVVDSEDFKN